MIVYRQQQSTPTTPGYYYGRVKSSHGAIQPRKVVEYNSSITQREPLIVDDGAVDECFTGLENFDWFGPVDECQESPTSGE